MLRSTTDVLVIADVLFCIMSFHLESQVDMSHQDTLIERNPLRVTVLTK